MSAQAASVYDNMPPAPILAPSWQEREDLRRRLLDTMQPGMLAALGAKDFDVFSSTVMPEAFYQPSSIFHRHLTNVVSVNQMTGRREIAVGPRGWGKSTTVTEGGTLWVVARNQYIPLSQRYKFILIVSDTTTQAEARLAVIKSNLETNEKIEQLYPDIYGKGPLWRAEMIVTRNDVCIATAGMNTSIRGTRYKNRRPDLILVDDPDDLDSANSPTLSRDKEERFTRDLLKCGHAKTDVLVVGTIISKMCLAYKLLYSDDFAAWNGTLFKALQEFPERMDLWNQWGDIIKDRTISNRAAKAMVFYRNNKEEMDKGGQSNWPEVYPVRNLMYEYYTEGRKSFLTEKQNQIIEADARHFQLEKYRFVGPDEYKRYMSMNPIMYMYIDPSGGASASSKKLLNLRGPDKFSATIIAKLSPRLYLLVAQTSKQCRQSAQFEEIAKLLQKYNVFRITSEDNAGQTHYTEGLKKFLTEKYADKDWVEMARLQGGTTHLILPRGVTNLVAKEERISMLEPYLDNFTLLLREDMNKDFRGLNDEFEDWPNSEFDDCLDSLSGAFFSAFRTFQLSYLLH